MHRSDVVLIGPLEPLLPNPLRVPLPVAMASAVILLCVGISAAILTLLPTVESALWTIAPSADSHSGDVSVLVVSRPAGASVLLNHGELGQTPASISASPDDLLLLQRDGFLDAFVPARGPSLDIPLWHKQPDVRQVRPPVPGASITSADFLPDGRVALSVEFPPNAAREAWAYDPVAARAARLGEVETPGAAAPSAVAVAPDAARTATIVRLDGLDNVPADQLTLTGPEEQQQPLSAVSTGERLLDATWSPRSDGVLVLSRLVSGGPSYELSFLQTDGQLRDLAQLPGEPIAGSWVWAPDGGSIAFLVHTTTVSLVTLDIQTGTLRYLDDLGADALPSSGAIAPAAWEPSGGLLYAGPARPSGSGGPVLHEVATGRTDAHRLGDVDPAWAPAVANEGVLFTLARRGGDELVLRPVDGKGHVLGEQPLGIQVSGAFSARWDFAHRQLLIVRGAPGGGIDVLLARFGSDDSHPAIDAASEQLEPHP
ncbi:MAG: hypothetical protein JO352_25990 [Chloroflexi bacterium]|nr:hypothetical protein [Chloroflexota bacterium]